MKLPDPTRIPVTKSMGPRKMSQRMEVVSVRVPIETFDDLTRTARLHGVSFSTHVRQLLILRLPK